MDSKLLYKVSTHLKTHIEWPKVADSEWIYCGVGDDIKADIIRETVSKHFNTDTLITVVSRSEVYQKSISAMLNVIVSLIDNKPFLVWDKDFKNVIEFNNIGVFRLGVCHVRFSVPQ